MDIFTQYKPIRNKVALLAAYEDGMSYRAKQSRILFAISASFVTFGSTISNALSPFVHWCGGDFS